MVCRYVWSRAEEALTNRHWASLHERSWVHAAWRGMAWGGSAFHVASLLNFLVFLRQGVYRCAPLPTTPGSLQADGL